MYLTDLDKQGVAALMTEWRQPRFRTDQVMAWLNKGARPEEMTNLPKALREQLAALPYGGSVIERKLTSPKDGTVKYLFLLEDGNLVEGVLMHYSYGNTACISTQVGCRMGCKFCASTLEGCVRDLRPGEMLSFIKLMEQDEPPREGWSRSVTNIVLMGSGEPLDNYDNVVTFLRRVTSPDELNISPRNISLSTCGLVPKIYRFMEEAPHVTLSISLHAHSDEVRRTMMPIANTYPIGDLIEAARAYAEKTGRRVVFEYALVEGVNDGREDAAALAKLLRGMVCHVNLIPLNSVKERSLMGVSRAHAEEFAGWLTKEHISATVRREMGADIDGACGQLRRRVIHEIQQPI